MMNEWANRLGYDFGESEVWKHETGFRVFTESKVLRVPYTVATSPETALMLCMEQGLNRAALDDMEWRDAQALYFATVPTQQEMF